ncbi:hypothetical protein D3C72_1034720 [compost metagenome]
MALAHADVEFEDVDDLFLALDLLGDQFEAIAAGQGGEVGGLDVRLGWQGRGAVQVQQLLDQQVGGDLDEAHVRALQVGEVQIQRLHLVDGEAEAQVRQLGHVARLGGAARVKGGLTQFEDQGVLQVAVLAEEVEELGEEGLVAQRGQRDVAEDPDLAVLTRQATHDLGAAEQQQVVDGGQKALALGHRQVFGRHHDPVRRIAQAGEALVEDGPALGQGDDRLQIEVDAVFRQGVVDGLEQGVGLDLTTALIGVGGDGRGRQTLVDRLAHLLDQTLQHPHLAGQGLGLGQGAALDGLGQLGQGALRRLHRIGQQAVRLADLGDLLAQGATVQNP